jgi:arylsulfatase A-like enzyme
MDVPDDAYDDGRIASTALDLIDLLSKKDKPFFLTVGFKKPHLPFVAPKKYWDLYDRNDFKVSTSKSLPKGAPSMAFQDSWELKNGSYSIKTNEKGFEPEFEQTMIHGYYASVSYTDAQVGRVLDHLKAKGLSENTVVLLWGDHGFHLGDHGMWCKHTNYEQSTRAPLIVADPRQTFALSHSDEPAEFIDVFPTLAELAGIPIPLWLEGKSLVSHLALNTPHKSFAVSQFPRNHQGKELMGYAYRTRDHRYIHWVDNQFSKKQKKNAPVLFEELYDYQNDPKETINFTNDPNYKSKLTSLRRLAQQHRRMMDQKIK